jgi:hypothetical protein
MVSRKLKPTKKVKVAFSRRKSTGFAAAPQGNFRDFNDYCRTDLDKKDCSSKIKSYLKSTLPKTDVQIALQAPEWAFTSIPFVAATIVWKEMKKEFPVWWKAEDCLTKHMNEIVSRGKAAGAKKDDEIVIPGLVKKSIQDIVKEKTSDFIAGIEALIDEYKPSNHKDHMTYSVYTELKKIDAPYNTAKAISAYYTPQRDEVKELVENKTEDLVEAYSFLSIPERKKWLEFLTQLVTDAEKYMASKKAIRATRAPKVKTADRQIERLKYATESSEFKLTSINPTSIVGAMRIYTFNVKSRTLSEYVCEKAIGFEVKGSTLVGVDNDLSRSVRLRKPDDFMPIIIGKNANMINKEWMSLTTKTTNGINGRINKDTILIRAMAK